MSRVAILPTGRTEWHGLPDALNRLFPKHDFYALPSESESRSYPERFPYQGFTSSTLTQTRVAAPPESATELVGRAAQAALGDRHEEAADLVIIVDDVELCNVGQERLILDVMHAAVNLHLSSIPNPRVEERTRGLLREKVSFHLIKPMIEAWFFADPSALATAGVPSDRPLHFEADCDPESFITIDPSYLSAAEADCTSLQRLSESRRRKKRPKWLGSQRRDLHPKGYLQWLCLDPTDEGCTCYSETHSGGRALAGISWAALFNRDPSHFAFLLALLNDIAHALDTAPQIRLPSSSPLTPSALSNAPRDAVLRNL